MRKKSTILNALFVFSLLFISGGCGGGNGSDGTTTDNTGPISYKYYQGSIPNSFYVLNIYGEKARKVTGKPFMVVKYNNINLDILDCELGLSEVTQTSVSNPSNFPAPPEPTLDAATIDYHSIFGLQGPVVLLVGWYSKSGITNGSQMFSFKKGSSPGGVGYNEQWSFSYNNASMTGDVKNIDTTYFLGRDSDTKAFNMIPL